MSFDGEAENSFAGRVFDYLNRRSTRRIFLSPSHGIGNRCEEIRWGLWRAQLEKKFLTLTYQIRLPKPFPVQANNTLRRFRSPLLDSRCLSPLKLGLWLLLHGCLAVDVVRSVIVSVRCRNRAHLNFYVWAGQDSLFGSDFGTRRFSWQSIENQDPKRSNGFLPPLSFTERDDRKFRQKLEDLGVPTGKWYVCLHVRDGGFHGDWSSRRNADIQSYLPAVKEIVNRGGVVVRMGDCRMRPAPLEEGLIDYAISEFKDEWFDLFLIQNCHLYIGMQSGITDAAVLLGRPLLITNMDCFTFWPLLKAQDRGILKHLYSDKLGRNLTISEMLALPFRFRDFALGQNDLSLTPKINSPTEILVAVVEALEVNELTEHSELQKQFRTARELRLRNEISKFEGRELRKDDLMYLNRTALRLSAEGTISRDFLVKNFK